MQGDGSFHRKLLHCSRKRPNAGAIAGVYCAELVAGRGHLNEVYSAGRLPGDRSGSDDSLLRPGEAVTLSSFILESNQCLIPLISIFTAFSTNHLSIFFAVLNINHNDIKAKS